MKLEFVFGLLLAFHVKHFLADYPMQRRFMLGKFKDGWDFVIPLLAHVGVHAAFTFLIVCQFGIGLAVKCALFDAVIHFTMDRIKASKKYLGRFKPLTESTTITATPDQWRNNDYFWLSLGLDQAVHHLPHYVIIWYIITQ